MRRSFGLWIAASAVALLVYLSQSPSDRAFRLGVLNGGIVARVAPGKSACQRAIDVPETGGFRRVTVDEVNGGLIVSVLRAGRPIARGRLRDGAARLDAAVPGGERVDVCLRNTSGGLALLMGGLYAAPSATYATLGKRVLPGGDIDVAFWCGCGRTKLERIGAELRNASLFKVQGAHLVWAILALIAALVGIPGLVLLAVREP